MGRKKRVYEAHETVYQRMKAAGIRSWGERNAQNVHRDGVEQCLEQFMVDALSQPWVPSKGKVIELGCGTGPVSRWLGKRGFRCLGVDVSKTAIAMAREQSKGLGVRFKQADVCNMAPAELGTFALVVDGHCLHCVTQPADRKVFLGNARELLRPGGVLLVATMCRPIDRGAFSKAHDEKLIGSTLYACWEQAGQFSGSRTINGKAHAPTRYIGHWRNILAEIRAAGFTLQLIRLNLHHSADPISCLYVAALAPK